ncbi:unnamed protein product [Cutaneotrichosporon oleaginosum]
MPNICSWSDIEFISPQPAPTPNNPLLLKRAPLSLPRIHNPPATLDDTKMYEPTHLALFRSKTGVDYAEPAYSTAVAPPLSRYFHSALHSSSTSSPSPLCGAYPPAFATAGIPTQPGALGDPGPPTPDPAIMGLKVAPRPSNYSSLDVWGRRQIDLERARMKSRIREAQKAEVERARKAAALARIRDKERERERRAAEKEEARKRKVAEKAYAQALKDSRRAVKQCTTVETTTPGFWCPPPPPCAYRRPLESGAWPLMSRTMTQAIHEFAYEDRLIRTANGQIVGFL